MAEKTTLNLSGYQPYKKMGQSCQLRDIAEFHNHWPKLSTAGNLTNSDLMMRYIRRNEVDEVVELWKNVYPEAYGSTHQFVFDLQWQFIGYQYFISCHSFVFLANRVLFFISHPRNELGVGLPCAILL